MKPVLIKEGYNVEFACGVRGKQNGAVSLSGNNSYIEIPHNNSLNFNQDDFFIRLWVKFPDDGISFGDLVCKFDEDTRTGFNFTINGTSGGYTAISDTRNVYFGIDSGSPPIWEDCNKPSWSNTLISSMCVFNGDLYAGIADAQDSSEACRVFHYLDGDQWVDCGRLGKDPESHSVFSMLVHKGRLYASTGVWDWDKAFAGKVAIGRVYCYEGGSEWRDCGQIGIGYRVMSMVSHNNELYAATDSSEVYRYLGGERWEFCGGGRRSISNDPYDIFRIDTMLSYRDTLFGGGRKRIFMYKGGTKWECIADSPFEVTQVHKLQVYQGILFAGTWPHVIKGTVLSETAQKLYNDQSINDIIL